jgi:hypothetical protein
MTNLTPGQTPAGGGLTQGHLSPTAAAQGAYSGDDPSNEPGQYPSSLFGVALPQGTGAGGSPGAGGAADPSNEPGQLSEGISGAGPSVNGESGAPGTMGQQNGSGGGDTINYTRPGSYLTGTNATDTVHDDISGPGDWTQAIDGSYAGAGPQLPGISGNEPVPGGRFQPGGGRVLRGGYRRGQR